MHYATTRRPRPAPRYAGKTCASRARYRAHIPSRTHNPSAHGRASLLGHAAVQTSLQRLRSAYVRARRKASTAGVQELPSSCSRGAHGIRSTKIGARCFLWMTNGPRPLQSAPGTARRLRKSWETRKLRGNRWVARARTRGRQTSTFRVMLQTKRSAKTQPLAPYWLPLRVRRARQVTLSVLHRHQRLPCCAKFVSDLCTPVPCAF